MKRVISVLLMCLMATVALACTTPETLRIASNIVWRYDNELTERTVYAVNRYNAAGIVIASGSYTSTVQFYEEAALFQLDTSFTLTYSEERTDTITSTAIFTRTGLKPMYSYKKRVISGEIPYDGAYTLTARDSYEYVAAYSTFSLNGVDYVKGANGTFYHGENQQRSFDMSHTAPEYYCDNEYMFYFIRSVHDLGAGYNKQFALADLFVSFAKEKPALTINTLNLAVAADEVVLSLPSSVVSSSGGGLMLKGEMADSGANGAVSALKTTISLAVENSGPSITAYYSAPVQGTAESFANNRMVLLGFDTEELTGINFSPALYSMSFRLTNIYNTL